MAILIYSAITSLDGYIEDAAGSFDWAAPGEEVHAFVNDLERKVGTFLYGRRMYETMRYWETAHLVPDRRTSVRQRSCPPPLPRGRVILRRGGFDPRAAEVPARISFWQSVESGACRS